jgi:hypothetical protein
MLSQGHGSDDEGARDEVPDLFVAIIHPCQTEVPDHPSVEQKGRTGRVESVVARFSQFCESIPDPACKDPSRAYYIGRKPDCERFFACGLDGSDFDVDAMIEKYPVPPPKEYKPTYTTFAPNTLRWANIEDSPYLHPKWFAEYQGRSLGHYPLLYTVMCSVVGYARKKGVELAHHELVDIAIAFDHACGGPVQSRHGHSLTAQRMQDVLDFVR